MVILMLVRKVKQKIILVVALRNLWELKKMFQRSLALHMEDIALIRNPAAKLVAAAEHMDIKN